MPELPEVETVRRGLLPWLEGHVVSDVHVLDERLVRPAVPECVEQLMRGRTVESVGRRGKYLLIELSGGKLALWHLRMTGSFAARELGQADNRYDLTHVRATVETAAGRIHYRDPRRFGTLEVGDRAVLGALLEGRLGIEPLEEGFDAAYLHRSLRRRRTAVKAALLDQGIIAGLGNIYVDEALHLSGIHPATPASRVTRPACARLVDSIRSRLAEAIDAGGSTLRDYRGVEGADGMMQERFVAYGRAGQQCHGCHATMVRGIVAGRGTVWCPRCQRRR